MDKFTSLIEKARECGISDCGIIKTRNLVIENKFAEICREPGCPDYGMSANCPPHSLNPDAFRELLKKHDHALVFKFEVLSESLIGSGWYEISCLIHETAAALEIFAGQNGFPDSRGFAGGSCKRIFCQDFNECSRLSEKPCRHPDSARVSMSGIGINVGELLNLLNWKRNFTSGHNNQEKMDIMVGMVLIGEKK